MGIDYEGMSAGLSDLVQMLIFIPSTWLSSNRRMDRPDQGWD